MHAKTRDRTGDLQIFSLTLSQLSYRGLQLHHRFQHVRRVASNVYSTHGAWGGEQKLHRQLNKTTSSSGSAGNRTRATSMATMYSATRPLMLLMSEWSDLRSGQQLMCYQQATSADERFSGTHQHPMRPDTWAPCMYH